MSTVLKFYFFGFPFFISIFVGIWVYSVRIGRCIAKYKTVLPQFSMNDSTPNGALNKKQEMSFLHSWSSTVDETDSFDMINDKEKICAYCKHYPKIRIFMLIMQIYHISFVVIFYITEYL
jgi:hypothetical protein